MSEDVMKTTEEANEKNAVAEEQRKLIIPSYPPMPTIKPELLEALGNIGKVANLQFLNSFKGISDAMSTKLLADIIEPTNKIIKSIGLFSDQYQRTANILSDIMQSNFKAMDAFRNLVIDFPLKDMMLKIDTATTLSVALKSASLVDKPNSMVSLSSVATQKTHIGLVEFETEQSLVFRFNRMEEKVNNVHTLLSDEIYPFLIEDSKRKDDILYDLLAYYKGKPQVSVKVADIDFSAKDYRLKINEIPVPIAKSRNEPFLCSILLKNKKAIAKLWDIEEVADIMGEDINDTQVVKKRIYQTVRQLNTKIFALAELPNFFVCTDKGVCVNPIYLKKQ